MKSSIEQMNPVFDNRIRLGIMSVLAVQETADFTAMRATLGVTDGNLASHMAVLERNRYVRVRKHFTGRKPVTTYAATETGRKAFASHLEVLERLIRAAK